MNTPFFTTTNEIDNIDELWGRKEMLKEIVDGIRQRMKSSPYYQDCMAFFGLAGSGKSSFLKCLFSEEQKRQLYFKPWWQKSTEAIHDIYQTITLNKTVKSPEELDAFLTEKIMSALDYVKKVDAERYALIQEHLRKPEKPSLANIDDNLEMLYATAKCHITLICDNFQRLTNSPGNFDETYEHLRSLVNGRKLSMILVTNEDFSKLDPKDRETSGSLFVHLFPKSNSITVSGVPLSGTKALIQHRLDTFYEDDDDRESRISLDEKDIRRIHWLSGGLPTLVCPVADFFFRRRAKKMSIPKKAEVFDCLLKDPSIFELFDQWCQSLNPDQKYVLKHYANSKSLDWRGKEIRSNKQKAWNYVEKRGLVIQDEETQEYSFITPLFEEYIKSNLRTGAETSVAASSADVPDTPPASAQATQNINYNFFVGNNHGTLFGSQQTIGSQTNNDNSQHLTIIRQEFTQKLEAIPTKLESSEFLELLRGGNSEALKQRIQEVVEPRLDLLDENPEYLEDESIVEAVNSNIGDCLLEEPTSEVECEEMEGIFAKIRTDCPEFDYISDVSLSKSCEYFLQAAAVVEHQLKNISFKDYSHISFLYGKALEQNLKDEFFNFFKHEEELSQSTISERDSRKIKDVGTRFTSIGTYGHIIKNSVSYLAKHCSAKKPQGYAMGSKEEWEKWWQELATNIDSAREIRNDCDHANGGIGETDALERRNKNGRRNRRNVLVSKNNNDEIKKCIFGTLSEAGIFRKSQIGTVLYDMLQQSRDANSHYHRTGMRR